METKRLRAIQQPSHLERLLDAYITRSDAVSKNAYQIRDPEAVVPLLRDILVRATVDGRVWACWEYGPQQWLFTAEMSLPLSRERRTPVLSIDRYNDHGELMETGNFLLDPHGLWRKCGE
ncbi:MAG: hypothetical protein JO184_15540 [Gammaproteobacteria bacterium]|nr:hypothetical protein [Gammaproteobacteria bacterium]